MTQRNLATTPRPGPRASVKIIHHGKRAYFAASGHTVPANGTLARIRSHIAAKGYSTRPAGVPNLGGRA